MKRHIESLASAILLIVTFAFGALVGMIVAECDLYPFGRVESEPTVIEETEIVSSNTVEEESKSRIVVDAWKGHSEQDGNYIMACWSVEGQSGNELVEQYCWCSDQFIWLFDKLGSDIFFMSDAELMAALNTCGA